jgi:Skp family chaperone for outer membrane proteins
MKRRFCAVASLSLALAAFAAVPAFAQKACMNEGKAAAHSYKEDSDLTATVADVQRLKQAGLDPNQYLVEYNGGYVLLTMKLHDLAAKSAAALESSKCSQKMMPFRKMADVKMIYQHYGLTSMLPPSMAKTDYYSVVGGARCHPAA